MFLYLWRTTKVREGSTQCHMHNKYSKTPNNALFLSMAACPTNPAPDFLEKTNADFMEFCLGAEFLDLLDASSWNSWISWTGRRLNKDPGGAELATGATKLTTAAS